MSDMIAYKVVGMVPLEGSATSIVVHASGALLIKNTQDKTSHYVADGYWRDCTTSQP